MMHPKQTGSALVPDIIRERRPPPDRALPRGALLPESSGVPGSCAAFERASEIAQATGPAAGQLGQGTASLLVMATTPPSEPLPQRLAAIREQMSLLADYL